jgi:hypothetical protein
MHHTLKTNILLILLLATQHAAHAQSMADIDKRMSAMLDKITYWAEYNGNDDKISASDSLSDQDDKLSKYLEKVSLKYPQTIKAKFVQAAKSGLSIVTSDDHRVRFYSWDTHLGGTMRNYSDRVQYQTTKGIRFICLNCDTTKDEDYGEDYDGITTIHTQTNKTVYIVFGSSKLSTKDRAEIVEAWEIAGNELQFANIFKAKTKNLSVIGYGYDMFASGDGDKDIPSIHLGKDNKRLYIPIVDGEKVTAKYLVYVWDGSQFVFDKDAH